MRKKSHSTQRQDLHDETLPPESMDKDEPDWDYSYDISISRESDPFGSLQSGDSIERDRSSALDSEPSARRRRDSSSSSARRKSNKDKPPPLIGVPTSTRKMSRLEILCANHQCALQQEPDTLYYHTITLERPKKRPEPTHRGQSTAADRSASTISRMSALRTMEENVRSMARADKRKEFKVTPKKRIDAPPTQSSKKSSTVPPKSPIKKTSVSTSVQKGAPVPEVVFERDDNKSSNAPVGCAMPSFSFTAATKRAALSPTSVNDIVEELTDLQDHLDSLRITKPNLPRREALLDAAMAAECKRDAKHVDAKYPKVDDESANDDTDVGKRDSEQYPKMDEELIEGVPFRAFGTDLSERGATDSPFSILLDALHQQDPPMVEEAFVDPCVRVRHFGSESDAPDLKISKCTDTDDSLGESAEVGPMRDAPESPKASKTKPKSPSSRDPLVSLLKKRDVSFSQEPEPIQTSKNMSRPPLIFKDSAETPSTSKSRSASKSSGSTLSSRKSFSILGAIASVRGKSSRPPAVVEVPARKSVRFSKKLVSSVQYRPKTLPHEVDQLYFTQEELAELERDRNERIYEEQFETVVAPDSTRVSVTYPVRRVEDPPPESTMTGGEQQPRAPSVDVEPRPVAEPLPPDLIDSSGSWSEDSESIPRPETYEI